MDVNWLNSEEPAYAQSLAGATESKGCGTSARRWFTKKIMRGHSKKELWGTNDSEYHLADVFFFLQGMCKDMDVSYYCVYV